MEIESQMKLEAQRFLQAILFHCFLELLPELIFWKCRFEAKFGPAAKHEMLKLNFLWYCHLLQIHRSRKLHFCINCFGFPSSPKIWRKLNSWFLLCINSWCICCIFCQILFNTIMEIWEKWWCQTSKGYMTVRFWYAILIKQEILRWYCCCVHCYWNYFIKELTHFEITWKTLLGQFTQILLYLNVCLQLCHNAQRSYFKCNTIFIFINMEKLSFCKVPITWNRQLDFFVGGENLR